RPPLLPCNLPEEIQGESVRVADAEAPVAPRLVRQLLLDRQPLGHGPLVPRFQLVRLDHHEGPLGGPVVPEVGGLPAPRPRQHLDHPGGGPEDRPPVVGAAVPRLQDGQFQPVPVEGDRRLVGRGEVRKPELALPHDTLRAGAAGPTAERGSGPASGPPPPYRSFRAAGRFKAKSSVCRPSLTSTRTLLPSASGGITSAG